LRRNGRGQGGWLAEEGLVLVVDAANRMQKHMPKAAEHGLKELVKCYSKDMKRLVRGKRKKRDPSCTRPVVTEIYLWQACSCRDVEGGDAWGQTSAAWCRRLTPC
jgi:hypothetical protein